MMMRSTITMALLILALSCCAAMATTVTANDPSVWIESADELIDRSSAPSINSNLRRGIRSLDPQQGAMQPQHVPSQQCTTQNPLQQTFAQNMLTNQGCGPTSSCGDICYVLTIEAASDLHSVVTGKTTNKTSHHWHDPNSFWRTGICNAKSQCVSVNPFDNKGSKGHKHLELQCLFPLCDILSKFFKITLVIYITTELKSIVVF